MRPAFKRQLFDKQRALPRMASACLLAPTFCQLTLDCLAHLQSWAPENLYNVWQRVSPDGLLTRESDFTRTSMTLFQQRWRAKRLARGYHGDHIGATKFARWYLPESLPAVHAANVPTSKSGSSSSSRNIARLVAGRTQIRAEEEKARKQKERESRTPIGTMMFREVERRLDVLVFRACFATSVWQARQMVVHRKVRVNGEIVNNPNIRLQPGDLFSVDPAAIPMLARPHSLKEESSVEKEDTKEEASAEGEAPEADESPVEPTATTSGDTHFTLPPYAAPHLFIPAYIEPSFKTCSAVYVRHPTARAGYSEIPSPYDADGEVLSLTWEFFKQRGESHQVL